MTLAKLLAASLLVGAARPERRGEGIQGDPLRHGRELRAVRERDASRARSSASRSITRKAICEKLKVTCTFQNQDWDGVIPALLSSKFDVIFSSMNITDARKQKVIFTQVYYATPPVFVGQASDKSNDVSPAP